MGVKSYSVLVPSGLPGREAQDKTRFVADGFSWLALIVPLGFFLWHRLWLEAGLCVLLDIVLAVVAVVLELDEPTATALILVVNALIAFEAQTIRRYGLERRGYHEAAVVHARSLDEAEHSFFAAQPAAPSYPTYRTPMRASSVIGLFPDPQMPRGV